MRFRFGPALPPTRRGDIANATGWRHVEVDAEPNLNLTIVGFLFSFHSLEAEKSTHVLHFRTYICRHSCDLEFEVDKKMLFGF